MQQAGQFESSVVTQPPSRFVDVVGLCVKLLHHQMIPYGDGALIHGEMRLHSCAR